MLQVTCIGHLGADAVAKNVNGKDFITFRIANTDKWTDEAGQEHKITTWVDCVMNGKPRVFEYLKKGQMVYASGSCSLRVYSSAKERCMKAGLTVNINRVELLGGKNDDVPSVLYSEDGAQEVEILKYYYAPQLRRDEKEAEIFNLISKTGGKFVCDRNGWVSKAVESEG